VKAHILPTLLLATGLFFGSPVLRAEGDKPAGPKPESSHPAGGDASPEARKQRMEEMRKKFDTNGDGKLDDTEKAAMREAMKNDPQFQKRREEMVKRFDTNGDGQLDETEKAAMKAKMGDGKGGDSKGGELKDKMLSRFDKNGDGKLDDAEKAEAKKEMEQRKSQTGQPGAPAKPPGS